MDASDITAIQEYVNERIQQASAYLRPPNSTLINATSFLELPLHIQHVRRVLADYSMLEGYLPSELHESTIHRLDSLLELLHERERNGPPALAHFTPPKARTPAGRNAYVIEKEELEAMINERLTNIEMAEMIGVSKNTIVRRRKQFNLPRPKTEMTNEEAEGLVLEVIEDGHVGVGSGAIEAALQIRGIKLPRAQLRAACKKVDRRGVVARWMEAVKRRRYSVPFPNSLWHMDGHHKLIRWGVVTHGCIDGKTRLVVFLRASTNNEASTVLKSFLEATDAHGWPSRIRADCGGENMLVKEAIERVRGLNRGSFIQGRSVHNQRIERLWRDVFRWKIANFKTTFESYELEEILDCDDYLDIWSLQFIFLPLINRSLDDFVSEWNVHKLRTERHSPLALFRLGAVRAKRAGFDIRADPWVHNDDNILAQGGIMPFTMYGATYGRQRVQEPGDPHVRVREVRAFLFASELEQLEEGLGARPTTVDMTWGKAAYLYTRSVCRHFLSLRCN